MNRKPVVAIVGRPNVGKSTFVNRLIGNRQSIVDDLPGVTRDRIYFDVEWLHKNFTVIDTGGIIPGDASPFLYTLNKNVLFYSMALMNSKIAGEMIPEKNHLLSEFSKPTTSLI